MFKKVRDVALIVKDGLRDGVRNLSGKLEGYFDDEMRALLEESRAEVEAVEKEEVLKELVICRDRMLRADKRIVVYKSLFFLLAAVQCAGLAGGNAGVFAGAPWWVAGAILVVEILAFWVIVGKEYRDKRQNAMKAEMLQARKPRLRRD